MCQHFSALSIRGKKPAFDSLVLVRPFSQYNTTTVFGNNPSPKQYPVISAPELVLSPDGAGREELMSYMTTDGIQALTLHVL